VSTGKKKSASRDNRHSSPNSSVVMDEYGTTGIADPRSPYEQKFQEKSSPKASSPRTKGSLWREAEATKEEHRKQEMTTEFTTDGINEGLLSFDELVERCRRLKASDARNHAEVRRLQRELHAFVSFPFDVTEERRNSARGIFEKVVEAEKEARALVESIQGEMYQARSVKALQGKDGEQPLETHRLRAALRREQAVREELQKEVDSLKGMSARATPQESTRSGADRESAAVMSEQMRKESARARSFEVMVGEKERECARLRQQTQQLRDEVADGKRLIHQLETDFNAEKALFEKEEQALKDRLAYLTEDLAVARDEASEAQRRYRVLSRQLEDRGIARNEPRESDLGFEKLTMAVHEPVSMEMLWEELCLVGHERDVLLQQVAQIVTTLRDEREALGVVPEDGDGGTETPESELESRTPSTGSYAEDEEEDDASSFATEDERGDRARKRGRRRGVGESGEVESRVEEADRLLKGLIDFMHRREQESATALVAAQLEYKRATGKELARSVGKQGGPASTGGGGDRKSAVLKVELEHGSRMGVLSLALRACEEEVRRLRATLQDVDVVRRLGEEGEGLEDAVMTLVLDLPYEQWCDEAEDRVVEEVAVVAGVEIDQIDIVDVQAGSVVVKFLIDAPDVAVCVQRIQADLAQPDGELAKAIGAVRFDPPAGRTKDARGGGSSGKAASWMTGLKDLVDGLSRTGERVVGGLGVGGSEGVAGVARGMYSNQAFEDAVLRAERAEQRAQVAEKYLLELGTPREVLAVLQRKCSEAQVNASRASGELLRVQKDAKRVSLLSLCACACDCCWACVHVCLKQRMRVNACASVEHVSWDSIRCGCV
jgi:hypothetical protein